MTPSIFLLLGAAASLQAGAHDSAPEPQIDRVEALAIESADAALIVQFEFAGSQAELRLARDTTTPEPTVLIEDRAGLRSMPHQALRHYRGQMTGHDASRVAAFRVGDSVHALVLDTATGRVQRLQPSDATGTSYTFGEVDPRDSAILGADGLGARSHTGSSTDLASPVPIALPASNAPVLLACAIDTDYEFVARVGGSDQDVTDFAAGTVLLASLIHEAYLGVQPYASVIRIRREPPSGTTDPNYTYTQPLITSVDPIQSPYFSLIALQWNTYTATPVNVVHLLTGKFHGTIGGLAWLDSACSPSWFFRASWSRLRPGKGPADLAYVLAHEIGHQLSLEHVSGPSIMAGNPDQPWAFFPSERVEVETFLGGSSHCPSSLGSVVPAPAITSVEQNVEVHEFETFLGFGARVTIQGTDLNYVHEFEVGGTTHYMDRITYISPTEIEVIVPGSSIASLGQTPITVHTPGGSSTGSTNVIAGTATEQLNVTISALGFPFPDLQYAVHSRPNALIYGTFNLSGSTTVRNTDIVLDPLTIAGTGTTDHLGNVLLLGSFQNSGAMFGQTFYTQCFGIGPGANDYDVSPIQAWN